jgi:hypothetical protein
VSRVRAVLVPGAPALLPSYAGQVDPVAELRACCRSAVADLVATSPSRLLVVAVPPLPDDSARGVTTSTGMHVGRHLLATIGQRAEPVDGWTTAPRDGDGVLFVGNGSACRSEKAPGHLDERAFGFDEALERTVRTGDAPPTDEDLAGDLWCFDLPVFEQLHRLAEGPAQMRYADDPYGVAYWVASWSRLRQVAP